MMYKNRSQICSSFFEKTQKTPKSYFYVAVMRDKNLRTIFLMSEKSQTWTYVVIEIQSERSYLTLLKSKP